MSDPHKKPCSAACKLLFRYFFSLILVISIGSPPISAQDLGTVLTGDTDEILYNYLLEEANRQFEERNQAFHRALESLERFADRQARLRRDYEANLGPFPDRTPLNAQITGTIDCDGYRIEKVIYESVPNHHVTANMYLPADDQGPYPGVLVLCGHSANGKAYEAYQRVCALLAQNDMVALIVDPISQGERYQFLDETGQPVVGSPTTSHTLLDVGAMFVGTDVVAYEAWDNIRGLDYLVSRPEVDAGKIGCTGNSGGGAQTRFLMALDDRIQVASPSCNIQTNQRRFVTPGAGDGCNHIPNEGDAGIEHVDYIGMRAPKPTLILGAEFDYFDVNAVSRTFRESKRVYKLHGATEQVDMYIDNLQHGYAEPLREVMVWWMRRWLLGDSTPIIEQEISTYPEETLRATEAGQVGSQWTDEVTVADRNLQRAKRLKSSRNTFWNQGDETACLQEIRHLIGMRDVRHEPAVRTVDEFEQYGHRIKTVVMKRPWEVPVPGLLLLPAADEAQPVTLYVDGRGKEEEFQEDGEIIQLLEKGHIVFSIDLRGFGETADDPDMGSKFRNDEHRVVTIALHLGRSLLGQRVEDILTAIDVLPALQNGDMNQLEVVGVGRAGPVVLHAAALDQRIKTVTIRNSINSWMDVVASPLAPNQLTHVVPGALSKYDLPDLLETIKPRTVNILDPVDLSGKEQE